MSENNTKTFEVDGTEFVLYGEGGLTLFLDPGYSQSPTAHFTKEEALKIADFIYESFSQKRNDNE